MKLNKKQTGLLAAAVLCIASVGGIGSYSFFSDKSTVVNDFSTGSLDLKVTESLWTNSTDGQNMYPGYTVSKNPTVQNVTGMKDNNAYVEAFIRVKDAHGNAITDQKRLELIYHMIRYNTTSDLLEGSNYSDSVITRSANVNPAFELVDTDYSKGTWTYYLSDKLVSSTTAEKGQSVTLFTTVAVPTDWSQTELDVVGDFQIEVEFKGIQEATFTDVFDAMKTLEGINAHVNYEENDSNRSDVVPSDDNMVQEEETEVPTETTTPEKPESPTETTPSTIEEE